MPAGSGESGGKGSGARGYRSRSSYGQLGSRSYAIIVLTFPTETPRPHTRTFTDLPFGSSVLCERCKWKLAQIREWISAGWKLNGYDEYLTVFMYLKGDNRKFNTRFMDIQTIVRYI